jgi:hypothetical protein
LSRTGGARRDQPFAVMPTAPTGRSPRSSSKPEARPGRRRRARSGAHWSIASERPERGPSTPVAGRLGLEERRSSPAPSDPLVPVGDEGQAAAEALELALAHDRCGVSSSSARPTSTGLATISQRIPDHSLGKHC